ncbi:hypothetical protein ACLOJK_033608 [Asimina triloba]
MALWLRCLLQGTSVSNVSHFPAMPRNSVLLNLPGTCLPHPFLGNGGRHGKHIQLRMRKVGYNCRNSTDQMKNVQLKLDCGCRFPIISNVHAMGNSANYSLPLKSGACSTRNTKNNLTLRSFEAKSNKSDSLPCEFMDRRLLSVQAMQKVRAPIATNKRSNKKVLDSIQKHDRNSTVEVSSPDGELQIQGPNLPVEKGSLRSSKSVSKLADDLQSKKKGIQHKNSRHENVDQQPVNNVEIGESTKPSKVVDTTKNPKAHVKQNQQRRKKKSSMPPSEISQPLGASEPLVSIMASQGKRCNEASSGQTLKTLANEIDQAAEHCQSITKSSFEKKGAQQKINAVKSDKIPAKKSKRVVQVLSSDGSPSSSNSKAGRASFSAGKINADNCRVKHWNGKLGPLYPPDGKSVVVVESATKASVIQKYLGNMFEVLPSYGHVRDLAGRSGSVRPDDDFSMVWEVPASAWTYLKSIKVALKGAKNLILASDPDREGEAIAWHVTEMLQQQDSLHEGISVARVTFCEITESAVKRALQSPRDIDKNLVHAYLARRALDYLIGFNISPLLWKKLPGCQSAGRVQSVALALACDREMEIDEFKPQEYWSVEAQFHKAEDTNVYFKSKLTHYNSMKLDKLSIGSEAEANTVEQKITSSNFEVVGAKRSKMQRNPPMPYITSSLQQDAANRLNFYADHTMKVRGYNISLAQKLYEGVKLSNDEAIGLITYMRTDGLHISDEVMKDIRMLVVERYGQDYTLKSNSKYVKVKNSQEAHEAIRPTNIRRLPSTLVGILDEDSLKLYTLIWSRTMASQMEPATVDKVYECNSNLVEILFFELTKVLHKVLKGFGACNSDNNKDELWCSSHGDSLCIVGGYSSSAFVYCYGLALANAVHVDIADDSKGTVLRSASSRVAFLGYQAVYKDHESAAVGRDENEENAREEGFNTLCTLQSGDRLNLSMVEIEQHHTEPPPRYSEASLVKRMEELGIGRPSTYASILKVLKKLSKVSAFLSHHFSEVTDYSFTADMETELDNVSNGTTEWKGLLKDYWARFSMYCDLTSKVDIRQDKRGKGKRFSQKGGKEKIGEIDEIGGKIQKGKRELSYSQFIKYMMWAGLGTTAKSCRLYDQGSQWFKSQEMAFLYKARARLVHGCPSLDSTMCRCSMHRVDPFVKDTYVIDDLMKGPDPVRLGSPGPRYIAKTMFNEDDEGNNPQKPDNSFTPKLLGLHPGSNEKVYLKNGPYGFYVQLGDDRNGYTPKRASILKATDTEKVTLEDALELLRYPLTLGKHPNDQEPVLLRISKFGYTVKHRRTVAPVPKGVQPQEITLERALKYLSSKNAKQCGRPKGRARMRTGFRRGCGAIMKEGVSFAKLGDSPHLWLRRETDKIAGGLSVKDLSGKAERLGLDQKLGLYVAYSFPRSYASRAVSRVEQSQTPTTDHRPHPKEDVLF